ncbi:hypothetical protein AAMO2058_000378300 [Amorphochlora amoebiformis]
MSSSQHRLTGPLATRERQSRGGQRKGEERRGGEGEGGGEGERGGEGEEEFGEDTEDTADAQDGTQGAGVISKGEREEIEYLESKLGLDSAKGRAKLKKEMKLIGLGDMNSFLDTVASGLGISAFSHSPPDPAPTPPSNSSEPHADKFSDFQARAEEDSDFEIFKNVETKSKSRLETPQGLSLISSKVARKAEEQPKSSRRVGAYVPPHLRERGGIKVKQEKAKRRINGLVNKLTFENIQPISNDIRRFYSDPEPEISRRFVTESLSCILLKSCEENGRTHVLNSLVEPQAALIAGLHISGIQGLASHLAETLCVRFNQLLDRKEDAEGHNLITDKSSHNILLFLVCLYTHGVIYAGLMYDIVKLLLNRFENMDIELLLLLLRNCGWKLREDDPAALKQIILLANAKTRSEKGKVPIRTQVLLDFISDLKNNKRRIQGGTSTVGSGTTGTSQLKAWIQKVRVDSRNPGGELQVPLNDFLNTPLNGRWWLTGAAWARTETKRKAVKDTTIHSEGDLMALAADMRMNTVIRKKVFCVVMGAADYLDAFEKLEKLKLSSSQEREILRVISHCCSAEESYNPYYGYLAGKLCSFNRGHKFTMQLLLWDLFKRWEGVSKRKATNLGLLTSHLLINFHISMSIFKVVEFDNLPDIATLYFYTVFRKVMNSKEGVIVSVFERIAGTIELDALRDGIWLFLNRFLVVKDPSKEKELSDEEKMKRKVARAKMRRRIKIATKSMGKAVKKGTQ